MEEVEVGRQGRLKRRKVATTKTTVGKQTGKTELV